MTKYTVIANGKSWTFESLDNAMLVYADAFKKYDNLKVVDSNGKIIAKKFN